MPDRESRYAGDWLKIAEQDMERVGKRLAEADSEDAAFRLQQAVEKFLKGFLLAHGWGLKRTHDVSALLTEAVRYDRRLERFRSLCRQIASYYIIERYPTFEEGPAIADVRRAYKAAQALARVVIAGSSKQ